MDEQCFRPFLCTVKAELDRGQPGLMRWTWDETLPQSSIDSSTFYSAAHRATKWASGRPLSLRGRGRGNWRTCMELQSIVDLDLVPDWSLSSRPPWTNTMIASEILIIHSKAPMTKHSRNYYLTTPKTVSIQLTAAKIGDF